MPLYDTIVEPFAGSAGYSLRYPDHHVQLYDKDEIICGIWDFLIHVSEAEIMALPTDINHVDELRDGPQECRWLVGFWMNKGTTMPSKTASAWKRKYGPTQRGVYWSPEVRQRIASQLQHIRHWSINLASYDDLPDMETTWFIDAPYDSAAGEHYKYGRKDIDYRVLGAWCKNRKGQVIVYETWGADWLPFCELGTFKGRRKTSHEVIWTNVADSHAHHAENKRPFLI
jgi:hypothetical protein